MPLLLTSVIVHHRPVGPEPLLLSVLAAPLQAGWFRALDAYRPAYPASHAAAQTSVVKILEAYRDPRAGLLARPNVGLRHRRSQRLLRLALPLPAFVDERISSRLNALTERSNRISLSVREERTCTECCVGSCDTSGARNLARPGNHTRCAIAVGNTGVKLRGRMRRRTIRRRSGTRLRTSQHEQTDALREKFRSSSRRGFKRFDNPINTNDCHHGHSGGHVRVLRSGWL